MSNVRKFEAITGLWLISSLCVQRKRRERERDGERERRKRKTDYSYSRGPSGDLFFQLQLQACPRRRINIALQLQSGPSQELEM